MHKVSVYIFNFIIVHGAWYSLTMRLLYQCVKYFRNCSIKKQYRCISTIVNRELPLTNGVGNIPTIGLGSWTEFGAQVRHVNMPMTNSNVDSIVSLISIKLLSGMFFI